MKKQYSLILLFALMLLTGAKVMAQQAVSDDKFNYQIVSPTDKTVMMTGYKSAPSGELKIPATVATPQGVYSVKKINANVFKSCTGITSVVLPKNVEEIGQNAFHGCENITEVNYKGEVGDWCAMKFEGAYANPLLYAGTMKFNGVAPSEITVPATVEMVQPFVFWGCENVKKVSFEEGCVEVGWGAFAHCPNLTTINLPESMIALDGYSIASCPKIEEMTFPKNMLYVGMGVLSDCESFKTLNFNAAAIRSWEVPEEPGYDAIFNGSSNFETVNFGEGVLIVPDHAFENCTSLKNVRISNELIGIGNSAFKNCTHIFGIVLPETVVLICPGAFQNCRSLDYINIPAGVQEIYEQTFADCKKLKTVQFSEGLKKIGEGAFAEIDSLQYIQFPETLDSISESAFSTCRNLRHIVVPSRLKYIGDFAFENCRGLELISAHPTTPTELSTGAFDGVKRGVKVEIPMGTLDAYEEAWDGYGFVFEEVSNYVAIERAERSEVAVTVLGGSLNLQAEGNVPVRIFDLGGRMLLNSRVSGSMEWSAPKAGIYLLQVADKPARKMYLAR